MELNFKTHFNGRQAVTNAAGLILIATLTGCSAIPASENHEWSEFAGKVDAHGALPVMHHEFNQLPFVEMLEGVESSKKVKCQQNKNDFTPTDYQCAIQKFYDRTRQLPDASQRLERNRIQEHILSVSEDRCNSYKRYLRYDQSMSNFWLGVGSTLAGGLGALAPTLTAAKTFSATGGVLSGISAEYNQNFYGNLFYSVITKAIDEQRREAYRQIQQYGQSKSLTDYPIEAAIKDAILYDGTCSAVSAMQYAEKAVQLVNDPGMDSMMRYLAKANQTRYIMQNGITNIDQLKERGIVSESEDSRFGSRLEEHSQFDPVDTIQEQIELANRKSPAQLTEELLDRVKTEYTEQDFDRIKLWNSWEEQDHLKSLAQAVEKQLGKIVDEFNTSIQGCIVPASKLHSQYTKAKVNLLTAPKQSDDLRSAQDVARINIELLNSKILGATAQFQDLQKSLELATLESVSKAAANKSEPQTLDWNYDKQANQFDQVCSTAAQPAQTGAGTQPALAQPAPAPKNRTTKKAPGKSPQSAH